MNQPSADSLLQRLRQAIASGDYLTAEELSLQLIERTPRDAAVWHLNGLVQHRLGRHEDALTSISRAIALAPEHPIYFNHYGAALQAIGRTIEALACFERAAQLRPTYLEAHANASSMYERLCQWELALKSIQRALKLDPRRIELRRRLPRLWMRLGNDTQALAAAQETVALQPDSALLYLDLGQALLNLQRFPDAEAAFHATLERDPNHAQATFLLGRALTEQDRLNEAGDVLDRAIVAGPNERLWRVARQLLCPAIFDSRAQLDAYREQFEQRLDRGELAIDGVSENELIGSGISPPFAMNFQGRLNRRIKEKFAAVIRPCVKRFPDRPANQGKPHIGFVVTRPHEWLFLRCSGGIVEKLDKQEFDVTVFTNASCIPALKRHIRCHATRFMPLADEFTSAAQAIYDARCDVLYHWEVGSDALNYLLPLAGAAPVQCTSWGTQVTSGLTEVNDYLSSRWIELDTADEHYTETLQRLESLPTYQRRVPMPPPTSKDFFGWSQQQHIYLCPQTLLKMHPDQDALFGKILEADPQATIVLKQGRYPANAERLARRLQASLGKLAQRIQFLPWLSQGDYFRLVSVADVVLDVLYYTAGSSCYDMFSLQQPLVTLPGELNVGRYTQACYRRMSFEELIAKSTEEYVRLAVQVASDAGYREYVRGQLRDRSEVLFVDQSAVVSHSAYFRQAAESGRC